MKKITEKEFREICIKNTMFQSSFYEILKSLDLVEEEPDWEAEEPDWEAEEHHPSIIPDGWLCEMWDDGKSYGVLKFFDKSNRTSFHTEGDRNGPPYKHYQMIPRKQWPKRAVEVHAKLDLEE